MPSSMGSIKITDWLQQQIWDNLGAINQLQTYTQHDLATIDPKLDLYKTN